MPFIRLLYLPVGERGVVSIPSHLRGGAIKNMALNNLTTLNSTLQKLK